MSEKRYLILAEGRSGDPHYGKTARGILRYAPDPTVAILDSTRAGETYEGVPVVATVEEGLQYGPTTAVVGVATQGGRFPPAWRELLKQSIAAGLDLESGLHEFVGEDEELVALAREHGVELRDLRKPPPDLNVPTGENLQIPARIVLTVGSTARSGRRRSRSSSTSKHAAAACRASSSRPDRPGSRSPAGDRGGRGRLGLPGGRGRAAGGRGPPARW